MSNIFRVKNFFAKQIMLSSIQEFEVEGVVFDIMALSTDLKERVELCESYDEMISLAAEGGLSFDGERAIDNDYLDVSALWGEGELSIDSDPCIQYRVGEKVCEISGLESVLEEMLENEEAARVEELLEKGNLDGSDLPLVNIDRLNEDAAVAQ
jgi:hypothetical protein